MSELLDRDLARTEKTREEKIKAIEKFVEEYLEKKRTIVKETRKLQVVADGIEPVRLAIYVGTALGFSGLAGMLTVTQGAPHAAASIGAGIAAGGAAVLVGGTAAMVRLIRKIETMSEKVATGIQDITESASCITESILTLDPYPRSQVYSDLALKRAREAHTRAIKRKREYENELASREIDLLEYYEELARRERDIRGIIEEGLAIQEIDLRIRECVEELARKQEIEFGTQKCQEKLARRREQYLTTLRQYKEELENREMKVYVFGVEEALYQGRVAETKILEFAEWTESVLKLVDKIYFEIKYLAKTLW